MTSPWFDNSVFSVSAEQLRALMPYLWLCGGIAVSTVAAGCGVKTPWARILHALILAPYAAFLLWSYREVPQALFGTSLEVDSITRVVGASVAILGILTGFLSGRDESRHMEWSPLMLISILGMSLLPGARDWVALFVFLETFSIAGYILTAADLHRESSLEAGLKYLFLGAFTSAVLLMGMTLLYGTSGSFDFSVIRQALTQGTAPSFVAVVGALFVCASLAFKAALVPFHMWAPDVYQAAPFGSAGFLASATKVAVFGALICVLERNGFLLLPEVKTFLQVIAIASVLVGNLMAWGQKSVRRMMAYSSVANAGYAALALSVGVSAAGSTLVSLMIYGVTVVGAFAMIEALARSMGGVHRYDLQIGELRPASERVTRFVPVFFAILFFSLAGIPPFPGFLGKYVVLRDIWAAGFKSGAIALVIGTLLGLGYYLRILVPMFMEDKEKNEAPHSGLSNRGPVFAGALCALVLMGCLIGFGRLQQWLELAEGFAR